MLVANFDKEASSATLGAQNAIAVTMTQDSSFITMMFSNLYSNQVLAAVREPICNGWDAMIDANKEDQYMDITFNDETGDLSIRDYGKGIPKESIGKIYGVIGGSTKRNNDKATGGFGLGSKAPWALVDSFRVTSRCNGQMTVYNMAKATLESNGDPMITPMVDVPCDAKDTGLTVEMRIPLVKIKEAIDYIQYAVSQGGIKARWNGTEMSVCGLDTIPGSYIADDSTRWYNSKFMANDSIFIRYGTVVYPVLRVPGTEKAVDLLTDFMNILHIKKILIQAAPGTLGLTPARESLSSGKLTEDGITNLCVNLIQQIETEIVEDLPKQLKKVETDLLNNWQKLAGVYVTTLENKVLEGCYFLEGMGRLYYQSRLGKTINKEWEPRLKNAEWAGWKKYAKQEHPKHFPMLLKLRQKKFQENVYGTPSDSQEKTEFFKSLYLKPCISNIHRAGFDLKEVIFMGIGAYSREGISLQEPSTNRWYNGITKLGGADNIYSLLQSIDNPILVINDVKKCFEKYNANPELQKTNCGYRKNSFFLYVPKDTDESILQEKIKAAIKLGFTVMDIRGEKDWDPAVILRKEKERKKLASLQKARETRAKKRAEALAKGEVIPGKPKVKNTLGTLGEFLSVPKKEWELFVPKETLDSPVYFMDATDVTHEYVTQFWKASKLTDDEKNTIVVVRNATERNMAIKRGAKPGKVYFAKKLYALVNEPGYKKYFLKHRQKGLSETFHISSQTLKILNALDIKVKGLDKYFHDENYEELRDLFVSGGTKILEYAVPIESRTSEQTHIVVSEPGYLKLEHSALVAKLLKVQNDEMICRLLNVGRYDEISIKDLLKEYPERKAALKSIVLSAFNSKEPTCKD